MRIKGKYRNGCDYDFSQENYLVEYDGGSFSTVLGAGNDAATIGDIGYDFSGNEGINQVGNDYIYKYQFEYLWIDVTAIRTENESGIDENKNRGYYQSILSLTGDGVYEVLHIEGFTDNLKSSFQNPDEMSFGIEREAPSVIPFSELYDKDTLSNSYLVGYVHYSSPLIGGSISLYPDSNGNDEDFYFTSTIGSNTVTFSYYVIFDPIRCDNVSSPLIIDPSNNSFDTEYGIVYSAIDTQNSTEYVVTGNIRIILDNNLILTSYPAASYTSKIYAVFIAD